MTEKPTPFEAVHRNPIWRDRANFIIAAEIADDTSEQQEWEQLWATQLGEAQFRICCIPFFAYDLALGDEVETAPKQSRQYVVNSVVRPSGHYTFRVWFGSESDNEIRKIVTDIVGRSAWGVEWYSDNLLAIDTPTFSAAEILGDHLHELEKAGRLTYETGRTKK